MNYWFFTVTKKNVNGVILESEDILKQRLTDRFWGLGERTPNRRSLKQGDRIIFYIGLPFMAFAATATLATDSFTLSDEQKDQYGHGMELYRADYGVILENIELWDNPRPVKDLIQVLKFIENKEYWGSYFQGGVRQISEDGYWTITDKNKLQFTEVSKTEDVILSESQFALEAHLEEFMDKNWRNISFGSNLIRYKTEEQDGRQFPAGSWSIDFLCVDKLTGDFVVIELKRGKSSDTAVGQILRYIGWVEENLAKPEQKTRGIIIAKEVDEGLRYAVKRLKDVTVLTYKIDFKLYPHES